jgi:hypothetical protein
MLFRFDQATGDPETDGSAAIDENVEISFFLLLHGLSFTAQMVDWFSINRF